MVNSLDEALNIIGQQLVDALRQELDKQRSGGKINASGNLSRSVIYDVVEVDGSPRIWIYYDDYGDAVNEGRSSSKRGGPKQSWRNKLECWMGYKGFTAVPGMTTKQTAFVITRAINKKGYKARPWVEPAIDRVLNQDFTKIFAEGIAAEIVSILNK